jgi:hypothetical protein
MSRALFGPGSRGDLTGRIQKSLQAAGVPLPDADQIFGGDTEKAVRQFQSRRNLASTGVVDDGTWTALTAAPIPELFERCLQLTAAFEGHDYTLAVGNFDGAWLTWGIIGFTMSNGEVQALLKAVDKADSGLIDQAFGAQAAELRQVLGGPSSGQKVWAVANTRQGGALAEPWKSGFAKLGGFDPVRLEQRRRALSRYFRPALETAARFQLATELGKALAFDIHVQNGGIGDDAARQVERTLGAIAHPVELDRREAIAHAVADNARPQYREDVRARKLAIARGTGVVHGRAYKLENWGLAELA